MNWQTPIPVRSVRLWSADPSQPRRASWLELFFDLIFVAAVAQVGGPAEVWIHGKAPRFQQPFWDVEPRFLFCSHQLLSSAEATYASAVSRSCLTCISNSVASAGPGLNSARSDGGYLLQVSLTI